jgi:ribonuclease VapC
VTDPATTRRITDAVNLFDSSALLCFLRGETGADVVERELLAGGACSAANWSEVAQKVAEREHDWRPARALLLSYGLTVEPVVAADAEAAARLWRRGVGLSLGDRLCLATAHRLDAVVWTADAAWGTAEPVRQVR